MPQNDESVLLENVKIIYRNFTGRETDYNQKGSRNFGVLLTPEMADGLMTDGYNVKTTKARELDEGEMTGGDPWLPVAVGYNVRPPQIWLITKRGRTLLEEGMLMLLDEAEVTHVDMYVRPYDWEMKTGAKGRKAYLKTLFITIQENELDEKYGDVPIAGARVSSSSIVDD